jgi:hypothetical protein
VSRPLFVLDVTDPVGPDGTRRFLDWVTRALDTGGTAASRMQGGGHGGGPIALVGAWRAADPGAGPAGRAYSLYACGGWSTGWRAMLQLYAGVPSSLFLSPIDGLRRRATTLPLLAAPGCPDRPAPAPLAVLELTDVPPGAELDHLASVREDRAPALAETGLTLGGLYVLALADSRVAVLWTTDADGYVRWCTAGEPPVREGTRTRARLLAAHPATR